MVECTLFMTHCLRLNLQLHTISLVRTCRISSFCTVARQLARLLLTRRNARSLGDSGASCCLSCRPTSSIKAQKGIPITYSSTIYIINSSNIINSIVKQFNSLWVFFNFSPRDGREILTEIYFTRLLYVHIYTKLRNFNQHYL